MHMKLKHPLTIFVVLWTVFVPLKTSAQDSPAAVPVVVVEAQPVATGNELVVLELFSSQACIFCPKADQLFSELIKADNVIGIACHVDYFEMHAGSFARPFCTARQSWYMQSLGAGPNYTPQLIVNGSADVVGYKAADVKAAMKKSQEENPVTPIKINKGTAEDSFNLSWNTKTTTTETEPAILWLMLLDKPHDLEIAEGRNKGTKLSYFNIASDLEERGGWDLSAQNKSIAAKLTDQHAGFVVVAQGKRTGHIIAAGQYKKPEKTPE